MLYFSLYRTVYCLILFSLLSIFSMQAQQTMEVLGQLNYTETYGDDVQLNDIWGYEANGREYALVGLTVGLSIVDVTEPENAAELFFIDGPTSTWRDIKTALDHAYVTNETGSGLLIVDLTMLPDTVGYYDYNTLDTLLWDAHNLFIDENNVAYVVGYNNLAQNISQHDKGVMMLDLNEDPKEPVLLGTYQDQYVHDVYVRDNIMYTSEIYEGQFAIVDVSDKTNPVILGTKTTPSLFTHNAWLSDDSNYLFTTDEKEDAYVASYDISNYNEIQELDRMQSNTGEGVIPHNVHVLNDFLVISYYQDGVVIVDANEPDILVETETYDTSISFSGPGFRGCWGVYPFLPSGNIIASDRQEGLVIMSATYARAGYLKGTVADSQTGENLQDVEVRVFSDSQLRYTDFFGNYKTGIIAPQSKKVRFSKLGYVTKDIDEVDFEEGITKYINVTLDPIEPISVTLQFEDSENGETLGNVTVDVFNDNFSSNTLTDDSGNTLLEGILPSDYTVFAGKWGYQTKFISSLELGESGTQVIELTPQYYDDFLFDFGWESSSDMDQGEWVLDNPLGTIFPDSEETYCNPEFDFSTDFGNNCYITGNQSSNTFQDDVDGTTTLHSPIMNLENYPDPHLSFYLWYCSDDTEASNVTLTAKVSNGTEEVVLQEWTGALASNDWNLQNYPLNDLITLTDNMQFSLSATDNSTDPDQLFEVGLDFFQINDTVTISPLGTESIVQNLSLHSYPNPFFDQNRLYINAAQSCSDCRLQIFDATGRLVQYIELEQGVQTLEWGADLPKGLYLLELNDGVERASLKVVKL